LSHARLHARVRSRLVASTAVAGLLAAGLVATLPADATASGPSDPTSSAYEAGRYIVLMDEVPTAAYRGGTDGFRATAPRGARTFKADSPAATRYSDHLRTRQDRVAGAVGVEPYYHYTTSLNGFAAELSAAQATALAKRPGVSAVVEDEIREPDTTNTPTFLGLTGTLGLWRRLGGASSATGAGRDVVVGIVDSGINSEHPSFADTGRPAPDSFTGTCDTGVRGDDGGFRCNDKIVGAHYYTAGQGGPDAIWEGEYLSPEDFGGHGSHTASTAAGNSGVPMSADGIDFGNGSGMAPAAKIAAYKVCWADEITEDNPEGSAGCATSDSVAAIDQAVADGVDVINYSISGAVDTSVDLVEVAFMYAADAGVFVAASAGNSGPGESTVAHPSPWLTTVAATTHSVNESTLVLGNGDSFVGASVTDGIEATEMVLAEDAAAAGADAAEATLCLPGTLDPAAVDGLMVVCDRGGNGRAEKSQVVAEAGGAAMVLVNVEEGSLNGDLHAIPSVHLSHTARDAVRSYVRSGTEANPATGEILAGVNEGTTTPPPPSIAGFSSRGPSLAAAGDLLKPDIAAPGVDVMAAVTPERNSGREFDFYSGTSMSSPHIAGLAALIIQKHPDWSPMVVKSAMMTTAGDLTDSDDPFLQGAGMVRPTSFMDPGLAFESDFDDWEDFLSGQGLPLTDNPVAASNFNTASVAVNDLAGIETVTREVTNVDDKTSTYRFSRTGLTGLKVKAEPATFTLAPGESQRLRLTFTRRRAALDAYAQGYLFLKDDRGHTVRFPAVVNPSGMEAPQEVTSDQPRFQVRTKSGVNGTVTGQRRGLVPAVDTEATAQNTDAADFDPADERNYTQDFVVGGPAQVLRVQVVGSFSADDDMDLFLTDADGNVVASSATATSEESITVSGLPAGTYTAHVQAWAVAGDAATTSFTLRSFHVKGAVGNWSVKPAQQRATVAEELTWRVTTDGLEPGTPYLGVISWRQVTGGSGAGRELNRTLVSIQP
jgi:subtilisin family serine protease